MLVLILLLLLLLLSMFLSLRKSSPSIRQQRLPLFLQHRRTARFVEDRPTCVCRTCFQCRASLTTRAHLTLTLTHSQLVTERIQRDDELEGKLRKYTANASDTIPRHLQHQKEQLRRLTGRLTCTRNEARLNVDPLRKSVAWRNKCAAVGLW